MPTTPPQEILLNAVHMNCIGDIAHGLWTHPRDESGRYTDPAYWTELARTLERGLFDTLFLADIIGANDVWEGKPDMALREGVQHPINDPLLLVPLMAQATQHLGFAATVNLSYEVPHLLARRLTTLDHLSRGRTAWNIVTGFLDSAARAAGLDQQLGHDARYDRADDFMEVVYKLWEGSWEDGAVLRDKAGRVHTRPDKVHRVTHDGPYYRTDTIFLSEPSPQRTPVLFQAGASGRGKDFAARHAECIFVSGNREQARGIVADIVRRAEALGRRREDLKFFVGAIVLVGRTTAEAQEKFTEYRRYASSEAGLAHFSAQTGIDFSRFDLDTPITNPDTQALKSFLESVTTNSQGKVWTPRKLLESMVLGSRHVPIVGSAEEVADALQAWVDEAGIDGFNLVRTVVPECFTDVVDLLVPVLQERGRYKRAYRPSSSYRARLFGENLLPARHTAARHRHGATGAQHG
jgi:FMN-dependent oxidoreductase (nitrilotriacetate monooxygenase family)